MKKNILLIALFCWMSSTVIYAQNKEMAFKVEVRYDTVGLHEPFEVKFKLENASLLHFQAPTFDGFKVVAGPMTSSNFSMINGVTTQSITYTYHLQAVDLGIYEIAAAVAETPEGELTSAPIALVVTENVERSLPDMQNDPFSVFKDQFGQNPFSNGFLDMQMPEMPSMDEMMKQFDQLFDMEMPDLNFGDTEATPKEHGPNQSPRKYNLPKKKEKQKTYKI
ncbi:MAG: protein BatD [Aureispira sp.]|nr:protein BatD [Aureispira sp.]